MFLCSNTNTDTLLVALRIYKTSVYSCGTGHEPIKGKGLPFAETTPSYFMWNLL